MSDFLVKLAINAAAVFAAMQFVPRIGFERRPGIEDLAGHWPQLLGVALILGLVNTYLRPIVQILSLPLSLFAVGVTGFVINAGMLLLVAWISGQLDLGFTIAGWPNAPLDADVIVTAVLASLVISVVSTLMGLVRLIVPGV